LSTLAFTTLPIVYIHKISTYLGNSVSIHKNWITSINHVHEIYTASQKTSFSSFEHNLGK